MDKPDKGAVQKHGDDTVYDFSPTTDGAQGLSQESWDLVAKTSPNTESNKDVISTQAVPGRNWLQTGFMSYHLDRQQTHERNFREQNYGIGLEHKLSENSSVSVGYYRNSIDKDSYYAAYAYQPLKAGPVKIGALAGVVTGYPLNNGGPIPMLLPLASIEGKRMGVNLTYVPKLKDVSSVLALQFKFVLD
jgi:Antimicrobial peptide resistance and lipid A acylation protein PagP.